MECHSQFAAAMEACSYDSTKNVLQYSLKPETSSNEERLWDTFTDLTGNSVKLVLRWKKLQSRLNRGRHRCELHKSNTGGTQATGGGNANTGGTTSFASSSGGVAATGGSRTTGGTSSSGGATYVTGIGSCAAPCGAALATNTIYTTSGFSSGATLYYDSTSGHLRCAIIQTRLPPTPPPFALHLFKHRRLFGSDAGLALVCIHDKLPVFLGILRV